MSKDDNTILIHIYAAEFRSALDYITLLLEGGCLIMLSIPKGYVSLLKLSLLSSHFEIDTQATKSGGIFDPPTSPSATKHAACPCAPSCSLPRPQSFPITLTTRDNERHK